MFNEDLDSIDNVVSKMVFFFTGPKLSCLKKRGKMEANSLRGISHSLNDDEISVAFAFFVRHDNYT